MKFDDLAHVFYINLASRPDRNDHMVTQLSAVGLPHATRFEAIRARNGAVGCTLSHVKILSDAFEARLPYVVVLEDDVCFTNPAQLRSSFDQFFEEKGANSWDVLLLGGNNVAPVAAVSSAYAKVQKCQTTIAYMVNGRYLETLLHNFRQSCARLIQTPHLHRLFALDKFWFLLQGRDRWFLLTPLTLTQLAGYSDIEQRAVNYDRIMLTLDKSAWKMKKMG
jgi:glycosyl transferase family 25